MHFRQHWIVVIAAILPSSLYAASQPRDFPPLAGHHQYKGCPPEKGQIEKVDGVDVSDHVDDVARQGFKDSDVKIVFRYYDWEDDSSKKPPNSKVAFEKRRTKFDDNNSFTYNWREGPTWRGKGLTSDELAELHDKNLLVGVVFQHFNSNIKTFEDKGRPAFDANRALKLAKDFNQPKHTVIFFGADHQFTAKQFKDHIHKYFEVVSPIIKAAE